MRLYCIYSTRLFLPIYFHMVHTRRHINTTLACTAAPELSIHLGSNVFNEKNIFIYSRFNTAVISVTRPITGLLSVKPIFEPWGGGCEAQSTLSIYPPAPHPKQEGKPHNEESLVPAANYERTCSTGSRNKVRHYSWDTTTRGEAAR